MSAQPPNSEQKNSLNSALPLQDVFLMAMGGSLGFIALVAFGAFAWEAYYANDTLELPTLFGVSGDFLSGVLGPLLSLVSIYFVVVTLREQRDTAVAERMNNKTDSFENRYYQLLRIHRDNAREMKYGNSSGRSAFVRIFEELHLAMTVLDEDDIKKLIGLPFPAQLQLAYYCVFFGVGPASSASLRPALAAVGTNLSNSQFKELEDRFLQIIDRFGGRPFKGHQSSLGHYYRHLYQMISFVHFEAEPGRAIEYIKSVRAQLSNYEQALLLVNSLTGIGWE